MNSRLRTSLLSVVLTTLLSTGGHGAEVPHVIIDGSTSPDGRYAVAWGIPYALINLQDMENVDLERVANYLVDLSTGNQIATLGTSFFQTPEFVKNHSSLEFSWKTDSRALFFIEQSKWGFESAGLVYITHPEKDYDSCSDVIPLTQAIRQAVREGLKQQHPELSSADDYVPAASPSNPLWTDSITLMTRAEIPKDTEGLLFEKALTFTPPPPFQLQPSETPPGPGNASSPLTSSTLISASSVGPVSLGMTIAEARRAMPGATFQQSSDGEGIAYVAVIENGDTLMELNAGGYDPEAPIDEAGVIEFIQVWSPRFQTAEGIGPGSALESAGTAYGGIKGIMMSEIESREYADFTHQPSGLYFRVTNANNLAGDYPPNDNLTTRYLPGAYLLAIEVTGPHIMADGKIAGIALGAPAAEVLTRGFGPIVKGTDVIWEAFGQAVQTWEFPESGLSFDMISDEIGGPKTVFSITATANATVSTAQGTRMGDSKETVIEAYRAYESTNEEMDGYFEGSDVHLVGSIYGGMIFTFENNRLVKIFLGAAAE